MQKVQEIKRYDKKGGIPINGTEVFLVEVPVISGTVDGDNPGVYSFADGVCAPAFGIGYLMDGEMRVFQSIADIARHIFNMNDEDTSIFENYAVSVGDQLCVDIIPIDGIVLLVNQGINDLAKTNPEVTFSDLQKTSETDRNIKMALSGAGQATLLGELIKTGTARYNNIHMNQKVNDIAKIIQDIRFIDDSGNVESLTLTGVDNILSQVKDILHVK